MSIAPQHVEFCKPGETSNSGALGEVCVVCGESFEAGRAGALYCSPSCKGKVYRWRYNEWKKAAMMRSAR